MTTPTPAPTSSPSVREVLGLLARAIETERDRQKCGVFFSALAATLDPAHLRALAIQPTSAEAHPDDLMVDALAAAMKAKLAKARAKGRGGWQDPEQCSVEYLWDLLDEHARKSNADMVDVANLAGMLHARTQADPDEHENLRLHIMARQPSPAALAEQKRALKQATEQLAEGSLWLHKKGCVYVEIERTIGRHGAPGEVCAYWNGVDSQTMYPVLTDEVHDGEEVVIYRLLDGHQPYMRPARLFDDGRFIPLTLAPAALLAAHAELLEREAARLEALQILHEGWERDGILLYAQETVTEADGTATWLNSKSRTEHDALRRCADELRAILPPQAPASAGGEE